MGVTLVTGGAKNLGRQISLSLAKKKVPIVIHYNKSEKEAFSLIQECRLFGGEVEAIQGDFSSEEGLLNFIESYKKRFPSTKNLINNVGNYLIKSALKTTFEEAQLLLHVNLLTPYFLTKELLPFIKEEKGSVINLGVAGIHENWADSYSTFYSLSKQALLMMTKSLAKEVAPFEVAVNMVSPGILEQTIDELKESFSLPMKRPATFLEVSELILFLLNENNHYITGQNIEIAGGVRL